MEQYMVYIWLGAAAIFGVIEGATAALNFVWFALGAVAAMIASLCGAELWLQLLLFAGVSVLTLALTKPFLKRFIVSRRTATNADRALEHEGVVMQEINNLANTGLVKVDGQVWTARTESNADIIPVGAVVKAARIEGVKLIVTAPESK